MLEDIMEKKSPFTLAKKIKYTGINQSRNTFIISKRRKLQNTSSRHRSRLKQMGRCLL